MACVPSIVERYLCGKGDSSGREPDVVEAPVGLLGHEEEVAAMSLGAMGKVTAHSAGVVDTLVTPMGNEDGDMVEALAGLLKRSNTVLVKDAARALQEIGEAAGSGPGVLQRLVDLLSDEHDEVIVSAADALCNMGEQFARRPAVLKPLVDMLGSGSRRKLCHAAQALGLMRGGEGKHAIRRAGGPRGRAAPHRHVYGHYAALGLGMMGEGAASRSGVVEVLMDMLSHADTGRARCAAKGIGTMVGAAVDTPGVMGALVGARPCRLG